MPRNKQIRKKLLKISNGVIGSLSDFILFSIFYSLSVRPGSTGYLGDPKAGESADALLANINYRSIKRTLYDLKRKGFIKYIKRETIVKEIITNEGRKRVEKLFPVYNEKRTWDKRLYLISYDIPKDKNPKRDLLRRFLKKLGCGYLQHSVWLTVYNPKTLIKELVKENNIPGQILVSDLGPDGSIGEKDIKTLVEEIYELHNLNYDYKEFIKRFKKANKKDRKIKQQACFAFFSILQDDPQLPFELLPSYWVGDDAYHLFKTFLE